MCITLLFGFLLPPFLYFSIPILALFLGIIFFSFARFYILRDLCFACRLVFRPRFRNGWVLLDRDVNYDTGSAMDASVNVVNVMAPVEK